MTPPHPRDVARRELDLALIASFPENVLQDAARLEEYGDALFAIAEHYDVPDETLLFWVQDKPAWKDWSLTSWKRFCEAYSALREQFRSAEPAEPAREALLAREPQPSRLCGRCFSTVVTEVGNGRRWCRKCGEVQQE
jgi:hypothetical protein